jgi:hypothetical protein
MNLVVTIVMFLFSFRRNLVTSSTKVVISRGRLAFANSARIAISYKRFEERRLSSNSVPPQFSRKTNDRFREGRNILAQSEKRNDNKQGDENFNLFEDIPEKQIEFRSGLPIMVEVLSFGPLGASVAVVAKGHNPVTNLPDDGNPLAVGLIYQSEIRYFREARRYVDVVLGEILPAYVDRVRDDGKIDVALRVIGGRAKVDKWSGDILSRLEEMGAIPLGNKSTPAEVAREFPGMSKGDFKKCIGALFARRELYPFPYSVLPYAEGLALEAARQKNEVYEQDGDNESNSRN